MRSSKGREVNHSFTRKETSTENLEHQERSQARGRARGLLRSRVVLDFDLLGSTMLASLRLVFLMSSSVLDRPDPDESILTRPLRLLLSDF